MADERAKDLELLLRTLTSQPNTAALRQLDLENMRLGEFVKAYASVPAIIDVVSSRSSLREDTVIAELSRLLLETAEDPVHVLEACCGIGTLPRRIIQALGDKIERVSYTAIDQDPAAIRSIKAQEREFNGFKSFKSIQRQVSDLEGFDDGSVDLIVLNNALHEIPPKHYPKLFSRFNNLLRPDRGFLFVVDMETLPTDQPESIAILWTAKEIEQILKAGDVPAVVTTHSKAIMVYHAQVRNSKRGIDEPKMTDQILRLLKTKLATCIADRQKLEATSFQIGSKLQDWVVLTGTIARYAEEIEQLQN